jgi:deferrochelatase/peroxidase EfeB
MGTDEPPNVFRRHPTPGVAPGRPHVRLANVEGPFGHKQAPPRAILREGCPFGEGGRGAVRARLAEVLEVAQYPGISAFRPKLEWFRPK